MDDALKYVRSKGAPIVVKCDGLALGKGVVVCHTISEAEEAVTSMMSDGIFGDSGNTVVIEEYMTGPEVTVLCFSDGKTLLAMPSSQDHKRAYDGDMGPNTGGMGSISFSFLYSGDREALPRGNFYTHSASNGTGRPPLQGCAILRIDANGRWS